MTTFNCKFCSYCKKSGHSLSECWCTRPTEWTEKPLETVFIPFSHVLEEKPFGYWHVGPTEEESDFFLYAVSGDVSCPTCIPLYTRPRETKNAI